MNPTKNRYFALAIIIAIVHIVLFGVYYVQTTMRQIESSLPIQVVNEKSALTSLTQNLGYLVNSISDLKDAPESTSTHQNALDDLQETQKHLTLIRETFRFENLLGAAAIHAVVYPALFDIDIWLKQGVHGLSPNSPIVLQLLQVRSSEAFQQSRELDNVANVLAAEIITKQSEDISRFSDIATFGLVAFVLLTGWLVILIWNQYSVTERLFNSDLRFRDFASITSDFLWETDSNLNTTYLSEKFGTLTGLDASQTLGQTLSPSLFDKQISKQEDAAFEKAFESQQQIDGVSFRYSSETTGEKFLRIDAKPIIDNNGNYQGYRGGVKDLTELNRAIKTAEEMKDLAETANKAKTNFLANMSHEIRSPIAIICGMADLLSESVRNPVNTKYLGIIKDSSESLLSLINRILDVSKIESNKMPLSFVSFDIGEMAESIHIAYSEIARKKSVKVNLKIDPDVTTAQTGDKFRIEQVLRNLVDNAVKFTESGEINIHISNHTESNKLIFCIEDTGVGIPLQKQQEMFEPFMQADDSTSRKYGGTGLGLAICKQLVERMGGDLWLESRLGEGSLFTFTIAFEKEPGSKNNEATSISQPDTPLRKLDILLAEDDPIMAMIFQENLRATGHRITHVSNGKEAVAAFSTEVFDMIFMDIQMPEMDGYKAVVKMRENPNTKNNKDIPIIALSASVLSSDIDRCLESGFTTHISKPFVKETLLYEISKLAQNILTNQAI